MAGTFNNIETNLIAKWHGNLIDTLIDENAELPKKELISLVSEKVENAIKDDMLAVSEGFISEIVENRLQYVDYSALVAFYKQD